MKHVFNIDHLFSRMGLHMAATSLLSYTPVHYPLFVLGNLGDKLSRYSEIYSISTPGE